MRMYALFVRVRVNILLVQVRKAFFADKDGFEPPT